MPLVEAPRFPPEMFSPAEHFLALVRGTLCPPARVPLMPPDGTLGSSALQAPVLACSPNFLLLVPVQDDSSNFPPRVPVLLSAGYWRTLAPVRALGSQAQAQVLQRLLVQVPPPAPPGARAVQGLCCTGRPPPERYQNISEPAAVWK